MTKSKFVCYTKWIRNYAFRLPIDEDTQVKHEEDVGNQTAIITKNPEEEIVNPEVNHVTETNLPSSSSEM